ncbi:MAG: hypothetical protein ACNA7U_02505 [Candidatus Izemoplasmataceae bacterium]
MSNLFELVRSILSLRPFSFAKEIVLNNYHPTNSEFLNSIAGFVVVGTSMLLYMLYKKARMPLKYDLIAALIIITFAAYLTYQLWFWALLLFGLVYLVVKVKQLV